MSPPPAYIYVYRSGYTIGPDGRERDTLIASTTIDDIPHGTLVLTYIISSMAEMKVSELHTQKFLAGKTRIGEM